MSYKLPSRKSKFFLVLCFLLFKNIFISQTTFSGRFSVKADTLSVNKYVPESKIDGDYKALFLKVNYGGFEIINTQEVEKLKNATITNVDLVYSKFPIDEDFTELNYRRVEFLHLICPTIFSNSMAQWRVIAQTGCHSEYAASNMLHGFYIRYKPGPTKESAARELSYLKDVLNNKVTLTDSTVFKIFNRNKWKNMTVVSDFTGSMSPYISQILLWYKLTFATKDFKEFIFFNDGDYKDDKLKKAGATGGIYYCNSTNKDTVLSTASKCSNSGSGGDIQENNIEAALYAVKMNPQVKEIIMLVDNWSPMRDYYLISQLKIPVHVIICGKSPGNSVNTEYLDLAYHTKGTLHTIEEDINDMKTIVEGKTVKIDNMDYRLIGGKFSRVK